MSYEIINLDNSKKQRKCGEKKTFKLKKDKKKLKCIKSKFTKKNNNKKGGYNWRIKIGPKEKEIDKKIEHYRFLRNDKETELGNQCFKARDLKEKLEKDIQNQILHKEIKDPTKSVFNVFREFVENPEYTKRKKEVEYNFKKCDKIKQEFESYDLQFRNAELEKYSK